MESVLSWADVGFTVAQVLSVFSIPKLSDSLNLFR